MKPGVLNPDVEKVMLESGINLKGSATLSVFDLWLTGHRYDAVIELCEKEALAGYPSFPGVLRTLEWPLPDPAGFEGSEEQRLQQVRELREQIRGRVIDFVKQAREASYWTS